MTQVVNKNFFDKICSDRQQLKFLTWGLLSGTSIVLHRGYLEMALGAYLLTQEKFIGSIKPINLNLFYPEGMIDAALKAPFNMFIKGHLWDLAQKVLAATAFYLTSNDSCLPEHFKIRSLAHSFFQKLEASFPVASFLYNFHVIDLTPVFFKFLHFFLDKKSAEEKGENKTVEFCKEVTYQLGKWSQVLWMARLFSVVCVNSDLQKRKSVLCGAIFALISAYVTASQPRPSHLNKLGVLSETFEKIKITDPEGLQKLLTQIQHELNQGNLSIDEKNFFGEYLRTKIGNELSEKIYAKWLKDEIFNQAGFDEHIPLIKGFSSQGVFEKLFISPIPFGDCQYRLEKIRFYILLMGLNLRRLIFKVRLKELNLEQADKIQYFLYFQTLENLQSKFVPEKPTAWDPAKDLRQLYVTWKNIVDLRDKNVVEKISKNLFFKPIFDMLSLIENCSDFSIIYRLRFFFSSLKRWLQGVQRTVSHQPDQDELAKVKLYFQKYSNIPNAATKTFEEIITICQGW